MRNYIILNNQNSNDISGLIIQELAPISKPLQRTQVETIDGRDGDIITPLGYAAYNKKIKIGLYGNFDINEIIAYFATQGTAIFSNEPDKYYNYQILDQIDYERLVRYRVATVTMHVQPFKYSATEGTLTIDASDTVSGEGSEIALDNTAEAPFSSLRYKGNATQDGAPTPDNPIEVKVLTGDSTVRITGKNLFDKNTANVLDGVYIHAANAKILPAAGTKVCYIPIAGGRTYTVSKVRSSRFLIGTTHDTPAVNVAVLESASGNSATTELTLTASDDAKYLAVFFYREASDPTITPDEIMATIQIEAGSSATDYEPYQGQSYDIDLGSIELCKIGNYQDRIYKENGNWYLHKEIGKIKFASSTAWTKHSTTNGNVFMLSDTGFIGYTYNTGRIAPALMDTDVAVALGSRPDSADGVFGINSVGAQLRVFRGTYDASYTVDTFKAEMVGHYIYGALTTPTDEAITDQALIDALDDFYEQAHAYKGRTHITATAQGDNAPAVLSVEVGEDNESTVTNAGNTTSRPILTIYGQGDIGVYINDVEVLDVALGDEEYITLDSVEVEAYKDTTANLKNRLVTGDYSKLALNAGDNKIRLTGTVTKYEISKYSRWL